MALDNETRNELSRESTRIRSKLRNIVMDEFTEFVLDNIGIPEGMDSVEFLDEAVSFLAEEFAGMDLK